MSHRLALLFLVAYTGSSSAVDPPPSQALRSPSRAWPWQWAEKTRVKVDFTWTCSRFPYDIQLKEVDPLQDDLVVSKSYEGLDSLVRSHSFDELLDDDGIPFPTAGYYTFNLEVIHTCTPDGGKVTFKLPIEDGKGCPVGRDLCIYIPKD